MVDYLALSYGLAVPAVVGVFVYAMLKGYRLRRKIRNTESFLTARNQVGPFRIAWSFYAGAVGAWVIASPAQYATFGGLLGLIMYSLASGLPFLMIAFAGDKIRNKVPHVLSLTDYIGWRFGDVAKTLVVLIALFNMSIALLAEYTTIGSIFKDFVGSVSYPMVILISVLALIYTAYGGLLVSIYTDTVQGVSSVLFFGILGIYMAATFRPGPLPTPMPCSPTDAFCISGTPDCGAFDRSMAETSAAAETDPSVYVTPPCPVTGRQKQRKKDKDGMAWIEKRNGQKSSCTERYAVMTTKKKQNHRIVHHCMCSGSRVPNFPPEQCQNKFISCSLFPFAGYSSILTMPASLFTATIFSEAMWQRAWASRDRRSLRLGAVIGSVAVITVVFFAGLCGLLAAWAGLISFGLEGEPPATNPNLYLFQVLYKGNFPTIPTVSNWIGAVCVLLASIMNEGAVDSLQNGMAAGITSYVAPIFKRWTLLHTRVAVVILNGVLIGIGIWLTLDQVKVGVLELFLITNILCCSAAFPVLLGLADSLHPFFGGASFVFSVLFSIFSLCGT
jgi:hypothetical protein